MSFYKLLESRSDSDRAHGVLAGDQVHLRGKRHENTARCNSAQSSRHDALCPRLIAPGTVVVGQHETQHATIRPPRDRSAKVLCTQSTGAAVDAARARALHLPGTAAFGALEQARIPAQPKPCAQRAHHDLGRLMEIFEADG